MWTAGCGPSKPDGSDYLGKWEGTVTQEVISLNGDVKSNYDCHLVISKTGETFMIKSEGENVDVCDQMNGGLYTLTSEGNLKNASSFIPIVISLEEEKNRAVVSVNGEMRHLTKIN
jgi:hypothetical protein